MKERILTAIVLLAIVVGALFLDPTGWATRILVVLIAGVVGSELGKLIRVPLLWIPLLLAVGLSIFLAGPTLSILVVAFLVSMPLLWYGMAKDSRFIAGAAGFCWVYCSLVPFFLLASAKNPAFWPLLMTAAIPIWCGDTAAIFVGKAIGKHKMAPDISPKKTWEGAAGNFLACVLAGLVLGVIFHYPLAWMALLGLNCGILGQAGDLFESWLKRKADVKDSGTILPGHGGVLDRIDSLMATAPISLLILQSLLPVTK
ncbi:MAG: phosphatidate cytidylyltransferase [Armatimonadetes bacterium]|nr:phosphatidate cytidylyltransferase [Armatimonadota bacterium]